MSFTAADGDWEQRVRTSFAKQGAMRSIGATIAHIAPGACAIALPFRDELSQQNGFFHAGMTAAIADSAGGYAGMTLFAAGSEVLTVEFKLNLVAPANGTALLAEAKVIRSGRTLTICTAEVFALREETRTLCAIMQQTLIRVDVRAA